METSKRQILRSHKDSILTQAFGNDLLLSLIFEVLKSSRDLKACRGVSLDWEKEATKSLRNFYFAKRVFLQLDLSNQDKRLTEFIATFSADPKRCPISCFRLDHEFVLHHDPDKGQGDLDIFFEKFGPGIKSLTVDLKYNFPYAQLQTWLINISKSVQELRIWIPRQHDENLSEDLKCEKVAADSNLSQMSKMTLLCLTLEKWGHPQRLPTRHVKVLETVLKKIPSGKPIKICLMQWENVEPMVTLLKTSQQLKNLKVLDIKELKNGEMKFLTEAAASGGSRVQGQPLKLEFLGISTEFRVMGNDRFLLPEEIHDFLVTQSRNLQMLEWTSHGGYFKIPECGFSLLKKLRLVADDDIAGRIDADALAQVQNWEITRRPFFYDHFFPTLEEFELESKSQTLNAFRSLFFPTQVPCTTLKKFGISYPATNALILGSISKTFPNITSLQIGIYSALMNHLVAARQLFTVLWRAPSFVANLRELSLEFEFNGYPTRGKYELDSLFSGVSEEAIQQLTESKKLVEFGVRIQENPAIREYIRRAGTILNLGHLKKLSISNIYRYRKNRRQNNNRFTDFSVFCTFEKLQNLEYLHVDEGIRDFSNSALNHLRKRKPLQNSNSNGNSDFGAIIRDREAQPAAAQRIEEVFRCWFTYKEANAVDPINLIGNEDEDMLKIPPPGRRSIPTLGMEAERDGR